MEEFWEHFVRNRVSVCGLIMSTGRRCSWAGLDVDFLFCCILVVCLSGLQIHCLTGVVAVLITGQC
jgi:hypothetical protein